MLNHNLTGLLNECGQVWVDLIQTDTILLAIKTAITIHTFYSALLLLVVSFNTFHLETYVVYISYEVNRHQKLFRLMVFQKLLPFLLKS